MKKITKIALTTFAIATISVVATATCNGNLNMHGFKITNLGAPEDANDATTKTYVDQLIIASASGGYPTQISEKSSDAKTLKGAADACSQMGGGWRLPTLNEIINLCASGRGNCTENQWKWTTDPHDRTYHLNDVRYYYLYNPANGDKTWHYRGSTAYYRCVR